MPILGTIASSRVTAVAGDFEFIATGNGNGSSASITFNSIAGTYKHLQVRGNGQAQYGSSTYGAVGTRFNGDTANTYSRHAFTANNPPSSFAIINNSWAQSGVSQLIGAAQDNTSIVIIDILAYTSTAFYKNVLGFAGIANSGNVEIGINSGYWANSGAITSVTIFNPNGNWEAKAQFSLYGIKG